MKSILCFILLCSTAQAGSGTLMATCSGKIEGNDIKVKTYVDPAIFCQENPAPSKGYFLFEDGPMSSVSDAVITYGPEYTVETEDGVKVTFESMSVPSMVKATLTGIAEDPIPLSCLTIEYHVSCE